MTGQEPFMFVNHLTCLSVLSETLPEILSISLCNPFQSRGTGSPHTARRMMILLVLARARVVTLEMLRHVNFSAHFPFYTTHQREK